MRNARTSVRALVALAVLLVAAAAGGCSDGGGEGSAPLSQADREAVDAAIADFVAQTRGDPWPALSMLYSSAEGAVLIYPGGDGDPLELCRRFADFLAGRQGPTATVPIAVYEDANSSEPLAEGRGSGDCSS